MTQKTKFGHLSLTLTAGALTLAASAASADQVINDDLIVQGSICVGQDCNNGESFGFDTLKLKENNLRIKFDDTSSSASFPNRDWQITINDSTNGGANKFSIDDITGGRTPFTIEAAAPNHSLYVDDGGRVGLGTSTPVVELHVVDGDSPTIRLQQDGSSGFTAQTWDVAGNEANFFVRDVTNSSKLPFKIKPGAPTDSLYVSASGNVGLGTASPGADLDILSNDIDAFTIRGNGIKVARLISNDGNPIQLRLQSDSDDNRRILAMSSDGLTQESQISMNSTSIYLAGATVTGADLWARVSASGIELPSGAAFSVNGTDLDVPDYVFAPDYELMPMTELQAFITANSHLPKVPSAAEVRAGGLNMTEMQLTLLEKVEELTLYTLEQQKMIDALHQRLNAQEN